MATNLDSPRDILNMLNQALKGMYEIRQKEKQWNDEERVYGPGYLKTLEALTCFGSIASNYKELREINNEFEITKIGKDHLNEDINQLISIVNEKGFIPEPYLDNEFAEAGLKYEKDKADFTDSVSYFLTCMLDLMQYAALNKEKIESEEEIEILINKAVRWLLESSFQKGDFVYWTGLSKDLSDGAPSIYFTWSATVGLSYALEHPLAKISEADRKIIEQKLLGVHKWICSIIKDDTSNKDRCIIDYPEIRTVYTANPRYANQQLILYCVSILDSLERHKIKINENIASRLFKNILSVMKDDYYVYNTKLGSHQVVTNLSRAVIEWEECALEYLLLTDLTWYYKRHQEKVKLPPLSDDEQSQLSDKIDTLLKRVVEDCDEGTHLWKKGAFIMFDTLRAFEAILAYLLNVSPYKKHSLSEEQIINGAVAEAIPDIINKISGKLNGLLMEMQSDIAKTISRNIHNLRK